MRGKRWIPQDRRKPSLERPFLEAPAPMANMPSAPPDELRENDDEAEESPRVIVIDI